MDKIKCTKDCDCRQGRLPCTCDKPPVHIGLYEWTLFAIIGIIGLSWFLLKD